MGGPARGKRGQFCRFGARLHAIHYAHGLLQRQITGGKHIGAAQRKQQITLRRPRANAGQCDQGFIYGLIIGLMQFGQIQLAED